jgi:competence protein ComEC
MNPWRPYPLLRVIFSFIAGILTSCWGLPSGAGLSLSALVLLVVVIVFTAVPYLFAAYRYRWVKGVMIQVAFFVTGNLLAATTEPAFFSKAMTCQGKQMTVIGRVDDQPVQLTHSVRVILKPLCLDTVSGKWVKMEKSLIYLKRDLSAESLNTGDVLLLSATMESIGVPLNPDGFDMRKYYNSRGVFLQTFCNPGKWKSLGYQSGFSLRRFAALTRDRLLDIFRKNNVTGQELAVASALLLGYINEIDRGLLKDYSVSGAMHILSVSGMHVGVIYIFLEFLLGFMNRRAGLMIIKAVILILLIWFYAMLTCLSPPVMRAAAMLTLVIAGKSMKRSPDILNILSASLFILLSINPFLILDIGFQFSYLAVSGIVLLYKPVYDLYTTRRWLPDKIWSLVGVSLVAQVVTFPLGLYAFHQFPNYFLLTNIVAVPFSSLIIYFGIFTLATGNIPVVSVISAKTFSFLVWLLNRMIQFVGGLPYAATTGVFIGSFDMVCLYVVITAFFSYFILKRKVFLFALLLAMIVLCSSFLVRKYERLRNFGFVVYKDRNGPLYDFFSQGSHILIRGIRPVAPDDFTLATLLNHYTVKGTEIHYCGYIQGEWDSVVRKQAPSFLYRIGRFVQFRGKRFAFVYEPPPKSISCRIRVDFLIIGGNQRLNIKEVIQHFDAGVIILDGTNSKWREKLWQGELEKLGKKSYSTALNGALIINF